MAFEEEFGVEIPDDAAEKITTVGDATKYIEEHKAKSPGNAPHSASFVPLPSPWGQGGRGTGHLIAGKWIRA